MSRKYAIFRIFNFIDSISVIFENIESFVKFKTKKVVSELVRHAKICLILIPLTLTTS